MLVETIRLIVVLAFTAGSYQFGQRTGGTLPGPFGGAEQGLFLVTALGSGVGYIFGGVLARSIDTGLRSAESRLAQLHASEVIAATLGLLIGLVLGALLVWPLLLFVDVPGVSYPVASIVIVVLGAFGTRYALRKRMEMFGVLGVTPAVEAGYVGGCLLDASAAIDGRIIGLWKAGLVPTPLCVPSFIIWELQGIADSADPLRRRRGQRGLDVLTSLREAGAPVRVLEDDPAATTDADAKLIVVARRRGMPIVTSDGNLAKAAELQGLKVLSLHALTELLRPPVVPGDRTRVQLVKEGRERGQAVGYLDDGTMVVVEHAVSALGTEVEAEVTSVLQTSTGRMVFARLPGEASAPGLRTAT